ncbi:alcohol dehydrogenase zinc-binding domain protein [Jimgerdemannia flammicorona]|uniref:Alcohol dehydrogenase zinc-binding domain protein n=1 Tax=Jimgerdemannia flammicorona TaxID=994334 RepID=A0A433QH38_9FUNG|nr:alcohol dehydrogenase zinc-binding domain protein [Jimgerdemannia flammicorona]
MAVRHSGTWHLANSGTCIPALGTFRHLAHSGTGTFRHLAHSGTWHIPALGSSTWQLDIPDAATMETKRMTDQQETMKAVVFTEYGSPDVLQLKDIDKPVVKDNEVLVRIRATSANAGDWHIMRGDPYLVRMLFGMLKPWKPTVLGNDFAGQVEAVGKNVSHFRPGDMVFGSALTGAFAEYISVSEDTPAPKPANMRFEQAAAIPCAAITALQAVRNAGRLERGQKVLINGAAGGVGTFAVQIAKSFGAEVTGVCSTRNVETVRSIGADHVIDYTREDFTLSGQRYDLIIDIVGNHSFSEFRRVLATKGTYVPVGGPGGGFLGSFADSLKAYALSHFMSQRVALLMATPNREDLVYLKGLFEAGKVTPVIDRQYTLIEAPEAIRYLEEGHARGKVVITV